jgi:cellulose biosynthesis protein BcsQ
MSQIITFYSYKGGVGRTMALANVATLLAKWGYRTLIVDWDLEAPGLENFFGEYIQASKISKRQKGIVDLLTSYTNKSRKKLDWKDLVVPISIPTIRQKIHLITAGQRDDEYFKKVREFDVTKFYDKNDGGNVIENLRDSWKESFDFILIDSRTGVTEIGGICTFSFLILM